ncbi:hypothetical protein HMI54_013228 [Coelomomyces lativittatus]|nr:hypothetical protein HMI54_013228 [Coelomomyces lativittatus]
MENKKPPFFFETSLHPQVYMKPEFRPMYNKTIEGHELMHTFGVDHDEKNVHCKGTSGAMRKQSDRDWKKFRPCNVVSMKWAKYYTKSTIDEKSHFYYEGDEIE